MHNINRFQGQGHRLGGNQNLQQIRARQVGQQAAQVEANALQQNAQVANPQQIPAPPEIPLQVNMPVLEQQNLQARINQVRINQPIIEQQNNFQPVNRELMRPDARVYSNQQHSLDLLADSNVLHGTRAMFYDNVNTAPENLPELRAFTNLTNEINSIVTNNHILYSGNLPNLPVDLQGYINASETEYNDSLASLQDVLLNNQNDLMNPYTNCFSFNDSNLYLTNNAELSLNGLTAIKDPFLNNIELRYMDQFQYRKTNTTTELNIFNRPNFLTSLIKTDNSKSIKFAPAKAHWSNFDTHRNDRRVGQEVEFDNNNNLISHKFIQYLTPDLDIVYDKVGNNIHLLNNQNLPFNQTKQDLESLFSIEASINYNNQGYSSNLMNLNNLSNRDLILNQQNIKTLKNDLDFLFDLPLNELQESPIIDLDQDGNRIEGSPTNFKYYNEDNNIIFEYKEENGIQNLKKYYPDLNNQLEYSASINNNNMNSTNITLYNRANTILRETLNATSFDVKFLLNDTVTEMINQGLDQSSILQNIRLLGSGFRHINQQMWDPQQALNELNKI